MENIEYVEEEVRKVIATGEFPLDSLRMSEEEQKNRIFEMLEKEGYDLGDKSELEVSYEGADSYDDGMSTKFIVTRKSLEIVPYEITKEEIFTGSLMLDGLRMSEEKQKNKIYEMMDLAGVDFENTDELEINYEGANSIEDGMTTDFKVFKVNRKKLANTADVSITSGVVVDRSTTISDDLAPEEITVQEVELEEIVNGTISVEGLSSKEEIDKKVRELLNNSGLEIRNIGELSFSYGDITSDGKMPFKVSKVIVEDVKYRVEKELIGTGISHDEDIYVDVQRDYGLDIRDDPNYEIIYGNENANGKEYRLVKITRTRLGNTDSDTYANSSLEESVEEYKDVLNSVSNLVRDKERVTTLRKKTEEVETMANQGKIEDTKKMLENLNQEINNLQTDLGRVTARYEDALANMKTLMNEEIVKLEEQGLLSDEELVEFREKYVQKRIEESFKITSIKKNVQLLKREIISLVNRKNVLEQKLGLGTEISEPMKSDGNSTALELIDALYDIDTEKVLQENARKIKAYDTSLEAIRSNALDLPEKIVSSSSVISVNNYIPLDAPEDMVEAMESKNNENKENLDKIVIYQNSKDGSYYARGPVFNRFNAHKQSDAVNIDKAVFYKIAEEDLDFILKNSNNSYSPYVVENRSFELEDNKNMELQVQNVKSKDIKELFKPRNENMERIVIYVDLDNNGERYVRKNVFDRFNAKKLGDEVRINNAVCYKISNEDSEFIIGNASNDYSPYNVEMREVHFKGKNGTTDEDDNNKVNENTSLDDNQENIRKKTIIIYRDINDNNQLYASSAILNKFGIKPTGSMTKIKGKNCYKISEAEDTKINELAHESKNPIYDIKYVDVKVKKKAKKKEEDSSSLENDAPVPHVEAIIDKLTTGLNIQAKDCKKFMDSNIKVAENFKNELKSGNVLYNINHFIPTVLRSGFSFLKKMAAKLLLSKRGKESMKELKRRLDEDLTEKELDVLFDEYRGSQLKADMNNQINGLVLEKLRAHGLAKVEVMNQNIKNDYTHLFVLLGQIKAIETSIKAGGLNNAELESLKNEKNSLFEMAATFVKDILINRKDANNLLSGGVHGLEEDFKAVATKLSYVGMRFAKTNKFDNELQHALGTYGQGLNDALAAADNKSIVDNFMGLESCYYDNTRITKSIFGKRSVGDKYYTPLAEQFDYRDDPFCTDVCTNLAVISAGVSTYAAFRVHQMEAKELLKSQQAEANNVNNANDSIMDYVHETGKNIEGKREAFQEGMNAQAHQDVLNSANAIERAELDMHNWSFSDAYRAADNQGHEFFNGFHQNVSSQINDVTARYGAGELTQAGALQEFANVANNAQNTLNNVSKECLNILNGYAKNHPHFDLSGIKESLDYVTNHPDAIVNMNNSMVDVTNLASGLNGLAANHMTVLESLPSDMASTLVCAASASALALRVSKAMNKKYAKKNGYGNEITEMMEDYLNSQNDIEDEYEDTHSR